MDHVPNCICGECEYRETVKRRIELDRRADAYSGLVGALRSIRAHECTETPCMVCCRIANHALRNAGED